MLRTCTEASATAAPEASVTVPKMVAAAACASSRAGPKTASNPTAAINLTLTCILSPLWRRPDTITHQREDRPGHAARRLGGGRCGRALYNELEPDANQSNVENRCAACRPMSPYFRGGSVVEKQTDGAVGFGRCQAGVNRFAVGQECDAAMGARSESGPTKG